MKESVFIEFAGQKIEHKQLLDTAKDIWKQDGKKIKDLKTLELYYKPEENSCYYILNKDITGEINGKFDV